MGGVAVKKGNKKLVDDINKTIKGLLDFGEYDKMTRQYIREISSFLL